MADDELRRLAREAHATRNDRDAAWRHARALERSGDRRGYLVAVSRLARLGDDEARAVTRDVVALPPVGLHRSRARRCAPLTDPWRVRTQRVDRVGQADVLAATERVLFLGDHEALMAVDTDRLVERWRRPFQGLWPFALRGEDVVVADGLDLVLLEGETGRELARAPQVGFPPQLVAEGDRAVALIGANDRRLWLLVGIDLGEEFGRGLWKRPHRDVDPGNRTLHGIHRDLVVLRTPPGGLRLDDGRPDPEAAEVARRLDHHGELDDRPRLEATCGGWSVAVARDPDVSQTVHDHAALEVTSPDGALRRVERPPLVAGSTPRRRPSRWIRSVALADTLGYAASTDTNAVNLVAVDLPTAAVRLDTTLPVDLQGEFNTVEVIALEHAVLVVVTTPAACTLFRLEGSR